MKFQDEVKLKTAEDILDLWRQYLDDYEDQLRANKTLGISVFPPSFERFMLWLLHHVEEATHE